MGEPRTSEQVALALATPRPRMGLLDVSSHLVGFAITTYDVDPDALAARLPKGVEPDLPGSGARAYVSAVTFLNTRFYVGWAPFVRLTCAQTNYRAYVRYRGEPGAFFFGTHLDSIFVQIPRRAWRMPWSRSRVVRAVELDDRDRVTRYEWRGRGGMGEERLTARGTGQPTGTLEGFRDEEETRRFLTNPMTGWLERTDGKLATYGVWHAPLELERCAVSEARFEAWERLGLVARDQPPHSVLAQALTHYLIFLPPRVVTAPR